ncbi:MAG: HEPN domain-containing protein [Chloroflexi bacterium]|nr:HEPN domain-containing protein [Ktedonobacteraceae bacterium]MBV9707889.1 HEPN domain-containing protein [Chloroflexota bacterium]
MPYDGNEDDIEQLLTEGVTLHDATEPSTSRGRAQQGNDDETADSALDTAFLKGDVQAALALFAEAAQDTATAGVELGLGRHFACVDYCNQAVEKAAQSVSLLRFGQRSMYDHDLRTLGAKVGAPAAIQDEMARLTPFHPETFYADTPPEEADEVISAEQASSYLQSTRSVMRWVKSIVLRMS